MLLGFLRLYNNISSFVTPNVNFTFSVYSFRISIFCRYYMHKSLKFVVFFSEGDYCLDRPLHGQLMLQVSKHLLSYIFFFLFWQIINEMKTVWFSMNKSMKCCNNLTSSFHSFLKSVSRTI